MSIYRFILFTLGLLLGYKVALGSWHSLVYVYVGEWRAPASVRTLKDYAAVPARALKLPIEDQMLGDATMTSKDGFLNVRLGHPLHKERDGMRRFACGTFGQPGTFDQIEIVFEGLGISESGHSPRLLVAVPCRASHSMGRLADISIPIQDIREQVGNRRRDTEIQITDPQSMLIGLSDLTYVWPEQWVLKSVRLLSTREPSLTLSISAEKWRHNGAKQISFNWKNVTRP